MTSDIRTFRFARVSGLRRASLALGVAAALSAPMIALPAEAATGTDIASGTVRFVGEPGTSFTLPGRGRYTGTIEVRPGPDGKITVINELSMDRYVDGLAEMPASWPMEALKAQAVAARTYAWHSIRLGTFQKRGLGFDICATVDCQVFHGRQMEDAPNGHRWLQAVAQTRNQTLQWEGEPILARYFSSSGGHTRNMEDVYGHEPPAGPRPYLKGVPDPDESISPHHRWSFEVSRAEFDRLLSQGSSLREVVPMRSIERVVADGRRVDQIRVTGQNGRVVEMSASKFRAWVSEVGPSVLPHRFPIELPNGKTLPDGLPTSRLDFCLTCKDGVVVVVGRGWGHGVGMSQWGARGKAERGMTHDDILAAYYNGVRPEVSPELPERVRVGLTWTADSVKVVPDGPYRVVLGDRNAWRDASDTWQLSRAGDGIRLTGPSTGWEPGPGPQPEQAPGTPAAPGQEDAEEALDRQPQAAGHAGVANAGGNDTTIREEDERGLFERLIRAATFVTPPGARLIVRLVNGT